MNSEQIKSIINLLPIPNKQKLLTAAETAAKIVNPNQNYTKEEALKVIKSNNINLSIIDKITPLLGLPMADNILNQLGTNKETLSSCLQELKGGSPVTNMQVATGKNSALLKELDQF